LRDGACCRSISQTNLSWPDWDENFVFGWSQALSKIARSRLHNELVERQDGRTTGFKYKVI
jgi:hypothetical protein